MNLVTKKDIVATCDVCDKEGPVIVDCFPGSKATFTCFDCGQDSEENLTPLQMLYRIESGQRRIEDRLGRLGGAVIVALGSMLAIALVAIAITALKEVPS